MSDNLPIKRLDSHVAWSCAWYNVRQDRILLPDGSQGIYNVLQTPGQGSVWIVPLTPYREVVMIHTYRYTLGNGYGNCPPGALNLTKLHWKLHKRNCDKKSEDNRRTGTF